MRSYITSASDSCSSRWLTASVLGKAWYGLGTATRPTLPDGSVTESALFLQFLLRLVDIESLERVSRMEFCKVHVSLEPMKNSYREPSMRLFPLVPKHRDYMTVVSDILSPPYTPNRCHLKTPSLCTSQSPIHRRVSGSPCSCVRYGIRN
ncbi:hypothetical protein ARMGADRAFT_120234 [Armillaria gallica]|uniref:Uncharacterized protein n=1 Tax=Armillaria gallica TaxID=47427 RepID=A0A2H3C8Z4_ARMGA|nr:hypothetical protein ARMGADRAFT_120234 [Armillaria gallica]